jgi:ABC-2 type transport system permease protein
MRRVFWVAWREFTATVMTKAFLIGIFLPPVMITLAMTLLPALMNREAPSVSGHIAVIDRSGQVGEKVVKAFSPEAVEKRRHERMEKLLAEVPPVPGAKEKIAESQKLTDKFAPPPQLSVVVLDPTTDVDAAKKPILEARGKEKETGNKETRLGLIVIPPEAVTPAKPGEYGGFELFVAPRLDIEVQGDIETQVARSIVDARLESNHLSVDDVRAMVKRPDVKTKAVTAQGDQQSNEAAKLLLPGAFMFLLYMSVMICGQGLLASTIEEKSTRVMELVLSAVTPVQLMVGKIIGQMAVGLVFLGVYASAGLAALTFFALLSNVDMMNLVWLGVFFVIAFGMMASLFAAVGSAVNDIREAQTLQTPLMLVMIIPILLWMPILRNPNSTFAQVMSFVPPASPFVMVLRLAGSEKIPAWQVPASIAVGLFFMLLFLWAAAKIFKVGVLMYGRPPNLLTLLKWIRMA